MVPEAEERNYLTSGETRSGWKTVAVFVETLVIVTVIAVIQYTANSLLEDRARYTLMLVGTCYGTWRGGKGPGVFALLFSGLIGAYVLTQQKFSLVASDIRDSVSLALYLVVGAVIILFGEALRKERLLLVERERDLTEAHKQLEQAHQSLETLLQKRANELSEIKRFVAEEELPASVPNPRLGTGLFGSSQELYAAEPDG
jgi:K+-sensing histidine kinase KdpD